MLSNINTDIRFISRYITVRSMLIKNAKKPLSRDLSRHMSEPKDSNQMVTEYSWPRTIETVDQKLGGVGEP